MKRVILEELDKENTFFHFTRKENIKFIEQNGLIATKGQNAKNVEITPKIFFHRKYKTSFPIATNTKSV